MLTQDSIHDALDKARVQFVDLWFTDITGMVKSVTIPRAQLADVLEHGSHFDGSSIEGFARVAESDMVLMPDLDTFAILPWENDGERTARLICSVYTLNGEPF